MSNEYQAKPSEIFDKRSSSAINCFTGAIVYCLQQRQIDVEEQDLLSCGGGFLWRAGLDEYGLPELTFPVEQTGVKALEFMGGSLIKTAMDIALLFNQTRRLLAEGPVICWVNSAYLDYTSLYTQSLGHLHTIVIDSYDEADEVFIIYDPLVVDLPPYACSAKIQPAQLRLALTQEVKTDEYDLMGQLISIDHEFTSITACITTCISSSECLIAQADNYFSENQYAGAIDLYRSLNEKAFSASQSDAQLKRLARRIFDHAKVLYILPSLTIQQQLCQSHHQAQVNHNLKNHKTENIKDMTVIEGMQSLESVESLKSEIALWKAIAILALKYEATLSNKVLSRLRSRFERASLLRDETWQCILNELSSQNANIAQAGATYAGKMNSSPEVYDDNQNGKLSAMVKSTQDTHCAQVQQYEEGITEELE